MLDQQDPAAAGPQALVYTGIARARLHGWKDPEVTSLLGGLMALRNPNGGWGLNIANDSFGDGSINPADTTYTVAIADHVGPFLLGEWQHGLIGKEPLTTVAALLVTLPRWSISGGACLPYSTSPYDRATSGYCVHNDNASVGLFPAQLDAAGVFVSGASTRRSLILKQRWRRTTRPSRTGHIGRAVRHCRTWTMPPSTLRRC